MKGLIFHYIFVVTALLCTPTSYGCEVQAEKDYIGCITYFENSSNFTVLSKTLGIICSANQTHNKQRVLDCQRNVMKACTNFSETTFLNGINLNIFDDINNELCKHKEVVLSGLRCYTENIKKVHVQLETLASSFHSIRQLVISKEGDSDEFLKEKCPLWKYLIDMFIYKALNCSDEFNKVIREYYYEQLPKKCLLITSNLPSVENETNTIKSETINQADSTTHMSDSEGVKAGSTVGNVTNNDYHETKTIKSETINQADSTTLKSDSDGIKAGSNIYISCLLILTILFTIG